MEAKIQALADRGSGVPGKAAPRRKKRVARAELCVTEQETIRAKLRLLACSGNWAESILRELSPAEGRNRGRRSIRCSVTEWGRLRGDVRLRYHHLLQAIQTAEVYPPPADDPACRMRPCLCRQCTRPGARSGRMQTKPTQVFWPAHYIVRGGISWTCAVNDALVDEEFLEANPELIAGDVLLDGRGGRAVRAGEAAEQIHFDPDAWREDSTADMIGLAVDRAVRRIDAWEREHGESVDFDRPAEFRRDQRLVNLLQPMPDGDVAAALMAHRWSHVAGEVRINRGGRETGSTVRLVERGLANLGSMSDFLELGHSLAKVRGLCAAQAEVLTQLVLDHPRDPRPRQAALERQEIRLGRKRKGRK